MEFTNKHKLKHKELSAKQTLELAGRSLLYRITRIIAMTLSVLFLALFIGTMLSRIINIGSIFGSILCVCTFLFFKYRFYFVLLKQWFYKKKALKWVWRTVKAGTYAFILYAAAATVIILACSLASPETDATAIVLGAQVKSYQDGTYGPSSMLQKRINAAYVYLTENPKADCIVSGGQGSNEPISEALCMYNELVEMGIDRSRIYMEDRSTNTEENLNFSYQIIEENNINKSLAVVSDGFHQARARLIAHKLGLSSPMGAINADTNVVYLPTFLVREWFALPFEGLLR